MCEVFISSDEIKKKIDTFLKLSLLEQIFGPIPSLWIFIGAYPTKRGWMRESISKKYEKKRNFLHSITMNETHITG